MQIEKAIRLAPLNNESTAALTDIMLVEGVVSYFEINYPDGCAGLVHTVVYHWDVKLWPSNETDTFTGNGIQIGFRPNYPLTRSPFTLTIKAWNTDDLYYHTPIYRLELQEKGTTPLDQLKRLFLLGG